MYGFKLWITGVRSNCCTNCATPLPIVLWFIILIKCKNYSKETGVCHFKTILAYSQHFFFICSFCFFQPNHYAQLNLLSAACKQISKIQEFQFSDTIIFSAFFCCRRQWWCCCFLFISFQSLTHSAFFKSGAQQYKTSWKHYCDQ